MAVLRFLNFIPHFWTKAKASFLHTHQGVLVGSPEDVDPADPRWAAERWHAKVDQNGYGSIPTKVSINGGIPMAGRFKKRKSQSKMDDLGVALFQEPSIC